MEAILNRYKDFLIYELNRSPLTVKAYMNDLYQFIDFLIPGDNKSSFDPKSVSKSDIRAWLNNIGLAGDSARTIRRKTQSIRSIFQISSYNQ